MIDPRTGATRITFTTMTISTDKIPAQDLPYVCRRAIGEVLMRMGCYLSREGYREDVEGKLIFPATVAIDYRHMGFDLQFLVTLKTQKFNADDQSV